METHRSALQGGVRTQVKPQLMDGVLEALRPHVTRSHLIISIAAGVRLASLEANLPEGTRVVCPMRCPALPGRWPPLLANHSSVLRQTPE